MLSPAEASQEGAGFSWSLTDDGEEVRHRHEYGSDAAWINTIHATLEVDQVLTGSLPSKLVEVGFALERPVSAVDASAELGALDQVLVYLVTSPVFDYAPGVLAVLEDGNFLGEVNDARVEFRFLDPALLGDGEVSVDQLQDLSRPP